MSFRYANRLRPGHVGRRVVIRRWVDDDERGRVPSDVLGVLEAWDERGVLTVRTADERLVEVAEGDVLAAKPVDRGDP